MRQVNVAIPGLHPMDEFMEVSQRPTCHHEFAVGIVTEDELVALAQPVHAFLAMCQTLEDQGMVTLGQARQFVPALVHGIPHAGLGHVGPLLVEVEDALPGGKGTEFLEQVKQSLTIL
jgi:hypothetical protein